MLRTRAGDSVKLMALLDEAVERAAAVVADRRPELDDGRARRRRPRGRHRRGEVRRPVERPHDRTTSSTGTGCSPSTATPAPYLQYAARPDPLDLPQGRHRRRARRDRRRSCSASPPSGRWPWHLLGLRARVRAGRRDLRAAPAVHLPLRPGAGLHRLLRAVPVLQAEDPAVRASAWPSAATTLAVMVRGLDLLGILGAGGDVSHRVWSGAVRRDGTLFPMKWTRAVHHLETLAQTCTDLGLTTGVLRAAGRAAVGDRGGPGRAARPRGGDRRARG